MREPYFIILYIKQKHKNYEQMIQIAKIKTAELVVFWHAFLMLLSSSQSRISTTKFQLCHRVIGTSEQLTQPKLLKLDN